jgi:hypothetical protein
MFDNHTFSKPLPLPEGVDATMDYLEECVEREGGMGFLGGKEDGVKGADWSWQWRSGDAWRTKARAIFLLVDDFEARRSVMLRNEIVEIVGKDDDDPFGTRGR